MAQFRSGICTRTDAPRCRGHTQTGDHISIHHPSELVHLMFGLRISLTITGPQRNKPGKLLYYLTIAEDYICELNKVIATDSEAALISWGKEKRIQQAQRLTVRVI